MLHLSVLVLGSLRAIIPRSTLVLLGDLENNPENPARSEKNWLTNGMWDVSCCMMKAKDEEDECIQRPELGSSGTETETDTQRVGRSRRELGEKSARKLDSVLLKDGRHTDPKMVLWAELGRLQPLPWKVPQQFWDKNKVLKKQTKKKTIKKWHVDY